MSRDLYEFAQLFSQGIGKAADIWAKGIDRSEMREYRRQQLAVARAKEARQTWKDGEWAKTQEAYRQKLARPGGGGSIRVGADKSATTPGFQAAMANRGMVGNDTDTPGAANLHVTLPEQIPAPPGYGGGEEADTFQFNGGVVPAIKTTGTNGPGSGFGQRAAPPIGAHPRMRNGGVVQKFVSGGVPKPAADFAGRTADRLGMGEGARAIGDAVGRAVDSALSSIFGNGPPMQIHGAASQKTGPETYPGPGPNPDTLESQTQTWSEPWMWAKHSGAAGATEPEVPPQPYFGGQRGGANDSPDQYYRDDVRNTPAAAWNGNDSPDQYYRDDVRSAPAAAPAGKPAPAAGGGAPAAGGGGGPKRRKALRDQTREEAYDPIADYADPDNIHAVDRWGRSRSPGAINTRSTPGRELPPATDPMGGAGLDPKGSSGYGAGLSTGNAANDFEAAQRAGVDFATKLFHLDANDSQSQRGYQAMISGHGAGAPHAVDTVLKAVDPEGKLPLDQRLSAAAQQVYKTYMAAGQPEKAAKSVFEIQQFGVKMSREHGKAAIAAVQKGNVNEAVHQLMVGYNWLPNGHTVNVDPSGQNFVIEAPDGSIAATYPVNQQTVKNFALGMATGQLGWDVLRGGGATPAGGPPAAPPGRQPWDEKRDRGPTTAIQPGLPPQVSQPTAQPQAAPAGPAAQPPAAMNTAPPTAPVSGTQPRPGAPAAGPASPPVSSPGAGQRAPTSPQPSAPQQASPKPPAGGGGTTGEPTETVKQPPSMQQRVQSLLDARRKADEEAAAKNPHHVPDRLIRRGSRDADVPPPEVFEAARADVMDWWRNENAVINKLVTEHKAKPGEYSKALAWAKTEAEKKLAEINKREEANSRKVSDLDRQESQRIRERRADADARQATLLNSFKTISDNAIKKYKTFDPIKEAEKGNKASEDFAYVHQSPLRSFRDERSASQLVDVAHSVWSNNPDSSMSEQRAFDIAMALTSFVPKGQKGANGHYGADGAHVVAVGHDTLGNVVLQTQAGEQVHVPRNVYTIINNLRRANYISFYEKEMPELDRQRKADERRGSIWDRTKKAFGAVDYTNR